MEERTSCRCLRLCIGHLSVASRGVAGMERRVHQTTTPCLQQYCKKLVVFSILSTAGPTSLSYEWHHHHVDVPRRADEQPMKLEVRRPFSMASWSQPYVQCFQDGGRSTQRRHVVEIGLSH